MARKANISREEIHLACWDLLETNNFPNIPRIADYFLQKDGRRCSNTTLMNAIAEWEESYKEHQQHQLKELNQLLLPVFKRFTREATHQLGQLLDEKGAETEERHNLKQKATEGGYLSLSQALIELQTQYDDLSEKYEEVSSYAASMEHKLSLSQQRYDDVLTQNKVLNSQLNQAQKANAELRINLAQKEVDLAKQDNLLSILTQEKLKLTAHVEELQNKQQIENHANWQELAKQLTELTSTVKTIEGNDRGRKK